MADLSDLSELEPGANDPVSSGDDEIRKSRLHTKNWAFVEHHLTGQHKFPTGVTNPGAGLVNRLFLNTAQEVIVRDDGSSYRLLRTNQLKDSFDGASLALTVAFQDMVSVTVDMPTDGRVIIFAGIGVSIPATGRNLTSVTLRVEYDGSGVNANQSTFLPDVNMVLACSGFWTLISPSTGSKVIKLRAAVLTTPTGTYSAVNRQLSAIIL